MQLVLSYATLLGETTTELIKTLLEQTPWKRVQSRPMLFGDEAWTAEVAQRTGLSYTRRPRGRSRDHPA